MLELPARILQISYFVVVGVFIVAALIRWIAHRQQPASVASDDPSFAPPQEPAEFPAHSPAAERAAPEFDPYLPGRAVPLRPPSLPAHPGVSIAAYRRLDFLWMGALCLLFYQLGMTQATEVGPTDFTKITVFMLIVSAAFQFVLAGITVAIVAWRVRPLSWLGLRWKRWPHVLWIGPAVVVGMWAVLIGLQAAGYMEWVETLGAETVQDSVKFFQFSEDRLALGAMAIAAVIVAPLCEEIVFRGYLYPATKRFTGQWAAMFCSALLFSLAHGSFAMLLPLFLLGFVFAWIYERTGSLWAPIFAHFCVNGSTVLIQFLARHFKLPLDL